MFNLKSFLLLCGETIFFSSCQNDPIVHTSLGSILGTVQTSRNGSNFYSFRGIRYAEAPVDDLRFQPPVPVSAWNGTYDATKDGPACYQKNLDYLSEDCLYLNVYTHQIKSSSNNRPVLVYIHGGAFAFWSGQSTVFGPDYLMDYDIVLVTMNYRLGTLGFFSTGDDVATGNYGMKDQVLVLKWVRDNIPHFGGDPTRVTIAGQSAGGAAISFHLVSPMSKGLFHRAIIMSGSAINPRFVNKNPIQLARKQAELLNCPTNTSEDMVNCIKKIPAEKIIGIYGNLTEWNSFGRINSPVVEDENCNCEKFLEKDPLDSFVEKNFVDVPVFIGTTKDEYITHAATVFQNESAIEDLSENFNEIAPKIFFYAKNDTTSKILKEFYLGTSSNFTANNRTFNGLGDLFSDSYVIFSTILNAKLLARKGKTPIYLYQFNYLGDGLQSCFGDKIPNRVAHQHDVFYVFFSSRICPVRFNLTSLDGQFVTKYTTLWYNFIETGNPVPDVSEELDNVEWEAFNNANPKYLDINQELTLQNGIYYKKRISLWENLFPLNN